MVDVVLGTFCGDEGKGKVVDYLATNYDICIRCTGESNAGHTIYFDGKKIVFHLVPTSILHSNIKSIIGTGTYINLEKLVDEIKYLNLMGISYDNLYISDKAHVTNVIGDVFYMKRKTRTSFWINSFNGSLFDYIFILILIFVIIYFMTVMTGGGL